MASVRKSTGHAQTRPEPRYFKNPAALRRWFTAHAAMATELVVGFMKTDTGAPSVTWSQAVDEALCVGWIDGVRHRIDDERYKIRFTPRKPGSHWSAVNIARIASLQAEGRMQATGLESFAQRSEAKSRKSSYEQTATPELSAAESRAFKKVTAAWAFYQALPPSYRKKLTWWVVSAKQQATRDHRLAQLVQACSEGKRL